jgi:hypothetical protein
MARWNPDLEDLWDYACMGALVEALHVFWCVGRWSV